MTNSFPCHPTVRKKHCSSDKICRRPWIAKNPFIYVVPRVVQRVDSNIHWINHYHLDNTIHYDNTDPLSTSWVTRAWMTNGHALYLMNLFTGACVGAVVRALVFHQCGPGSVPASDVIRWLSLLVLYSAPRGFPPGAPVFPSHQKPTFDLIWFPVYPIRRASVLG